MRVLLVDDEKELVSALAERLMLRGIDAEWYTTGAEALKRVESGCFDLAVLDVKMPKLGGLELKEKLKGKCPDMKFIFLTGCGSEKDFISATTSQGKSYYLLIPVDIQELMEKMQSLFDA